MARSGRVSSRKYRWTSTLIEPTLIPVATSVLYPLLSPLIPPAVPSDGIYQGMTSPTLIAVQGQVTIYCQVGATPPAEFSNFAWGIYVDDDASNLATANTPFTNSASSNWMMWHTDTVADTSGNTNPASDIFYRRYNFTQRRYKRKLESGTDTVAFVIENGPAAVSQISIVAHAYFRMLLLE